MINSSFPSSTAGWMAIAVAAAGLVSGVFFLLFFTIGEPFGTLTDIATGIMGILSGLLAWRLYSWHHSESPLLSVFAVLAAAAGAALVVTGSALVVSRTTGWYLAGLYTGAGGALIGLWLLGVNYSARQANPWPQAWVIFGIVAGLLMAVGLLNLFGILNGIDSWDTAPWYLNYVGQPGTWIGILGYLAWCVMVGRVLIGKQADWKRPSPRRLRALPKPTGLLREGDAVRDLSCRGEGKCRTVLLLLSHSEYEG